MANGVQISNLASRIDEASLRDLFGQIGEVRAVEIEKDPRTGRSRGSGRVEMSWEVDAYRAAHILNGVTLARKRLLVRELEDPRRQTQTKRPRTS